MKDIEECRKLLLDSFPNSFFNDNDEFIAHLKSNTYFIFKNCETVLDVKCKILEWLSRSAHKGCCYNTEWRNRKFRDFIKDGINYFLDTDFSYNDFEQIYTYLGNCCNHKKTIRFIESEYDMKVLTEDR